MTKDMLESFESLIAGICVNARAASECREATRITLQTLRDQEFWTEFAKARHHQIANLSGGST